MEISASRSEKWGTALTSTSSTSALCTSSAALVMIRLSTISPNKLSGFSKPSLPPILDSKCFSWNGYDEYDSKHDAKRDLHRFQAFLRRQRQLVGYQVVGRIIYASSRHQWKDS